MNNNIDITKPVTTRDGKKILGITRIDVPGNAFPIVGVVEGDSIPKNWKDNGDFYRDGSGSILNIINVKEKIIVPLTSADIKPTDIFRRNHTEVGFHTIGCLSENLIAINGIQGSFTFPYLRENFLISRDGGTTWERCEKEIEE